MRIQPKSLPVLLLGAATAVGCFNPAAPSDEETAAVDSGTTSAETTEGPIPSDSSAGDAADDTTAGPAASTGLDSESGSIDLPPEILQFQVDGSTSPSELSSTGLILLDVDAVDDIGIDLVEFYDGEDLIATSTVSPYTTEVLLSSADNGPHEFRAVVYDTAKQSAQSDTVAQSVNIDGGVFITTRNDIDDIEVSRFHSMDLVLHNDEVHAIGTSHPNESTPGIVYAIFSSELADVTRHLIPASSFGEERVSVEGGPPTFVDDQLLTTGFASEGFPADNRMVMAFTLNPLSGAGVQLELEEAATYSTVAFAVDNGGAFIYAGSAQATIHKAASPGSAPLWSDFIEGVSPRNIVVTLADEIVIDIPASHCPEGSDLCVRKYSPEGRILWTRGLQGAAGSARLATAPDGMIAVVPEAGQQLFLLDTAGNSSLVPISTPKGVVLRRIHLDRQGHLLMAGRTQYIEPLATGWIGRVSIAGELLWERELGLGQGTDVTGVATSPAGRLYVAGHFDLEADIFNHHATGFVSEIEL